VTAVAACKDLIVAAADVGNKADGYVRFWNASDGKMSDLEISRGGFNAPVRFNFLRFTTDDTYLIMGSEHSGTRYRRRPGGIAADCFSGFEVLSCSADMNTLLVRWPDFLKCKPNQLYLHVNPWEVRDNFLKHLAVFDEECEAITHADVSPNDRRLAIAGTDAVIRVYNRDKLKLLHKIELPKKTKITAVRLSDGGRLAVIGEAGFAKLFDDAGIEISNLKGHEGTVSAVAFSPDSKWLATAAGKVVRLFDTAKGKPAGEIAGHKEIVTALAFSSDGKRLVTGSADKTAKVWERKE
jgi:WD40 repeat protein